MRKRIALSVLALTGAILLVAACIALPQDPDDIGLGLKVTLSASGVAFMLALVGCVFVAWPEKQGSEGK